MLRSVSRRERIRKFLALGFEDPSAGGKHQFVKTGARQAGISHDEWLNA